jgi:hypothetical protein
MAGRSCPLVEDILQHRPSVRPHAFEHDEGLSVGPEATAPNAAGEFPDPSPIGCVQRHMSTVETQSNVAVRPAVLEDMGANHMTDAAWSTHSRSPSRRNRTSPDGFGAPTACSARS